jgi:hypothetical protein
MLTYSHYLSNSGTGSIRKRRNTCETKQIKKLKTGVSPEATKTTNLHVGLIVHEG